MFHRTDKYDRESHCRYPSAMLSEQKTSRTASGSNADLFVAFHPLSSIDSLSRLCLLVPLPLRIILVNGDVAAKRYQLPSKIMPAVPREKAQSRKRRFNGGEDWLILAWRISCSDFCISSLGIGTKVRCRGTLLDLENIEREKSWLDCNYERWHCSSNISEFQRGALFLGLQRSLLTRSGWIVVQIGHWEFFFFILS